MKTKMITIGILLSGLAISLTSYTNRTKTSNYIEETEKIIVSEGETLFKAKCTACHTTTKPEDMSKLIAPPMMGVMMHVKKGVKGKTETEKRENAIDFIVDYVQNPSAEKSMMGKFKVMPSQKANVTVAEIETIANYLYDNFPAKGMKHGKMKKGNKKSGCEAGCGTGCEGNCKH
ncbi:MAG: cytochrome c [Flavobacteriales bacterium]|nr:cytochrome c [Flavobacteriales bacterium]